ncbi:ribosomal protein L49/IMG2 [Phlebopus sp. FC_14]|nr:ribosomal protein L49/IMG2 [Phlebopus sp. FC_14]
MLRHIKHFLPAVRAYSQEAVSPYFVRRTKQGSLPVYSHTGNAGTRVFVEIRNVEGRVDSLASDLQQSLFAQHSPEAARMKIQTRQQRHLVVGGGRWRREVVEWLTSKGF